MTSEKFLKPVTPAKAGVYNPSKRLDSGFRRNDEDGVRGTFTKPSNLKLLQVFIQKVVITVFHIETYPIRHRTFHLT